MFVCVEAKAAEEISPEEVEDRAKDGDPKAQSEVRLLIALCSFIPPVLSLCRRRCLGNIIVTQRAGHDHQACSAEPFNCNIFEHFGITWCSDGLLVQTGIHSLWGHSPPG